ncbi:MAG: U32 family peptidase [Eggerthellaceae bacterium]|nr:U32 family peptidase [Eggerthellaceae bacterium]
MSTSTRIPELLAPAGNMECLHAAVCAGADAVYLGLEEFNARRNAGNFSTADFRIACDYAHLRGVAVYVTLNVEILPSELARAVDFARRAWLAGADAFIVQDVGLADALHRELPQAELHVSTQMNVHNAAGIEAAARLGARRVTLARELRLAEIAELAELAGNFDMEIECFAHGALCICYSGQCLMSSMIGGRSANRGLCAQACRLPYELRRSDRQGALPSEGEHLLSPRDLCSIDLLAQLADTGIASLKIEGRMKSADYVHEVVSVYREALDALAAGGDARHEWSRRLAEAFSRGFTTAYLEGKRGNDIMSYGRPNNRGVFAGRVSREGDGVAEVASEIELHEGDVVEFWTNRGHFAATIPAGQSRAAGEVARIPVEQRVGKGDRVFRVRNAATAFTLFAEDPFAPRVTVNGLVELHMGTRAHVQFTASDGTIGEAWGDEVEPARTKALTEEDVRAHVDRLGQTPFALGALDVQMSEGAGMGFSKLHHLRADALEALAEELLIPWRTRTAESEDEMHRPAFADVGRRLRDSKRSTPTCLVAAWATNPGCARAARRAGADALHVPLLNFKRGQAQLAGVRQDQVEQAGYPKQCVMAFPTIDHDPLPETREGRQSFDPWDYAREGKPAFADNLGAVMRLLDAGALVEAGPHVPLVNAAALRYAAELGVQRVWLSPELTLGQIAELAENSPVELGLCVSGAQELMICEHCLLMSQGECVETCETCARRSVAHRLVDRKGFEFPVVTDMLGRSHLYNGLELDIVPNIHDLIDMGVTAFMVDTTLMDKKTAESAVARVVRAVDLAKREHRSVGKRPNTTTGHLFRGVL